MNSSIHKLFVGEKLHAISRYAQELETVLLRSDDEIRKDFILFHSLERIIQLITDEMIDVNTHIIKHAPLRGPDDFQSTFRVLAEQSVFPEQFADHLAPIVGLRNRLVHRYESIDIDLLIANARSDQKDIRSYVGYIDAYIKSIGTVS